MGVGLCVVRPCLLLLFLEILLAGLVLGAPDESTQTFSKGDTKSSRLVVTFQTARDNVNASELDLGGARVVKQYGRRLVLDLGGPFDIDAQRESFNSKLQAVQSVELDYLVSADQDFDGLQINDALVVTNATDPDMDGAAISPASQTPLWNLMDSEPYSIKAEGVWPVTNSTPDVVVAVIDTGIAELAKPMFLNLLDGYDFITDDGISIDWDGRDPDATDPGDWGDICPTPSWHGTKVASILAARHDNEFGMKGVAQNCSVLPIRVLGICRMGYATDVTDAIVWAAGGTIDGVPDNDHPANIISLSLAGQGACPDYMQSAVTQAVGLGSIIIAAAGNNNQNVSGFFPANCKGVISVAASTREGKLAGYSNWGTLVAAPGGDSVNAIMSLSVNELETGLKVAFGMGTSFASPHAAGVAALYNSLSPDILLSTALLNRYFLSMSIRGNCTQALCGNGILSAHQMLTQTNNHSFLETLAHWNSSTNLTVDAAVILDTQLGLSVPAGSRCCTGSVDTYMYNGVRYGICNAICPCQPGRYTPLTNQIECTQCPSGSVSRSTTGSATLEAACTVCPRNTYGSLPSTLCTSCLVNTYSNPGSSECQAAITECPVRRNPFFAGAPGGFSWYASCPLGSYICGVNFLGIFAMYFYCCTFGGLQVGHHRIATSNFAGSYVSTFESTATPPSPWPVHNTINVYRYGIQRLRSSYYGAEVYSGTNVFSTGTVSANDAFADSSCSGGNIATGLYGYWGANLDQKYLLCNNLCAACSTCLAGNYIQTPCYSSLTSDRSCQQCPVGKYSLTSDLLLESSCTPCSEGKYSVTSGASLSGTCISCPAGTFSISAGASATSACTMCSAGKFSTLQGANSATLCSNCIAGTFSTASGASAAGTCRACPAGTFSTMSGAISNASCQNCLAGTYCQGGNSAPTACAAGKYSTATMAVSDVCQNCPAGTFRTATEGNAVSSCTVCSAGKYSTVLGLSTNTCQDCLAGTYSAVASSSCLNCTAGTYSSANGSTTCLNCTARFNFSVTFGATTCTACVNPTFCVISQEYIRSCTASSGASCASCNSLLTGPPNSYWVGGVDTCTWVCNIGYYKSGSTCQLCRNASACGTGQYTTLCTSEADGICDSCINRPASHSYYTGNSPSVGANNACPWACNAGYSRVGSSCNICAAGSYSLGGAAVCTACTAGKFSTVSGANSSSTCQDCNGGSFSSANGATVCTACPAGRRSGANSATCSPCPNGTFSSSGSAACTGCARGKYSQTPEATSSAACIDCPAGTFSITNPASSSSVCLSCNSTSYTPSVGASTCTLCPLCTLTGHFRFACSGTSPGTCERCNNTA